MAQCGDNHAYYIQYTESGNNHAPILIKPLGINAFATHRSFLTSLPEEIALFYESN